jgi:signal peptidase I
MKFLNWGFFLLALSVLYLAAGPVSIGGPASYVIVDGASMEPTYHSGDLVVAIERNEYKVGDTIVYDAPINHQFNVIHRIIEPTDGGWVTQGDNMERPDGWIAPHDEIHGVALFHIPNGGAIVDFLRTPAALAALLAGWVFFEMAKREERKKADKPSPRRVIRVEGPARKRGAMNKPAHVLLVALSVMLVSAFTGSAASLNVDAGTLQAFFCRRRKICAAGDLLRQVTSDPVIEVEVEAETAEPAEGDEENDLDDGDVSDEVLSSDSSTDANDETGVAEQVD